MGEDLSIYLEFVTEGIRPSLAALERLADALMSFGYVIRGLDHGFAVQAAEDPPLEAAVALVVSRVYTATDAAGLPLPEAVRLEAVPDH